MFPPAAVTSNHCALQLNLGEGLPAQGQDVSCECWLSAVTFAPRLTHSPPFAQAGWLIR
jgi:hypothetical protein